MFVDEHSRELKQLEAEQAQLEEQVALFELERETTKTDVVRFKKRYYDTVGRLLVELDTLLAGISQQQADADPLNSDAQQLAREAHERARQSAQEAGLIEAQPEPPVVITPECKKSYRKAAMLMHPDRATSDAERERRTQMMALVNIAYERGDQDAIEKLIVEFGEDPEAIAGDDILSRILKSTRRIAQLGRRMIEIELELNGIREAEIFQLMTAVIEAEALGENPLGDLAAKLLQELSKRRMALNKTSSMAKYPVDSG